MALEDLKWVAKTLLPKELWEKVRYIKWVTEETVFPNEKGLVSK